MNSNVFRRWYENATPEERSKLAKVVGTSTESLRQMAFGFRTGGELRVSAETAHAIEKGTNRLKRSGLHPVRREKLCPACGGCDLAKKARKSTDEENV